MGRLEVRVCGARNIGNVQKVGTPDPYVKVKIGDKKDKNRIKFKTRVVENSLNPIWNEHFKFQIADYDTTQVLFELWNENVVVDDLMGSYGLALNGLVRGVVHDFWAILQGTKVSSAELHLRVLAVDFGLDPKPGDTVIASIEQEPMPCPLNQTYRPHKRPYPNPQPYAQAPQGPPQQVTYGAPSGLVGGYGPGPTGVAGGYIVSPAPAAPYSPPPQPAYYPPPQPAYGAPPPQPSYYPQRPPVQQPMQPPNFQVGSGPMRPPDFSQYRPQQQAAQIAFGIPPDM